MRSLFSVLAVTMLAVCWPLSADDNSEPPLVFDVVIGDKELSLQEGQSGEITGLFDGAKVSVKVRPYRDFSKSGITFSYPRSYVFEADASDVAFKSWTVEGSSVVVMVFVSADKFSASDYIAELVPQFGEDAVSLKEPRASLRLGRRTLSGAKAVLDIGGQKLSQDAYEIPMSGGRGGLLVIQDTLTETGGHSGEFQSTLNLLAATFAVK